MISTTTLKDFYPNNTWILDYERLRFLEDDSIPYYIIDQSTGREYLNESPNIIRFKCTMLALGSPIVQSMASLVIVVRDSALKILFFSHFWLPNEVNSSSLEKLHDLFQDILKILLCLPVIIALEASALYGIFNPYDGRKLYASIERAYYKGSFFLAPCFQPNPSRHAFGGDIKKRNVF